MPRFADPQTSQEIDNINEWHKCRDFLNRSGKKLSRKTCTGQTEDYPESKHRLNTGPKALYQALDTVPAIITKGKFQEVVAEKERRSNITLAEQGQVRKTTHYSMK